MGVPLSLCSFGNGVGRVSQISSLSACVVWQKVRSLGCDFTVRKSHVFIMAGECRRL